MSMSSGARGNASAEINVTPLIDVLLVLLIIFMVIVPHHGQGEAADIPKPNKMDHPVPDPDPIVVELLHVSGNNLPLLKINSEPVAWDALHGRLEEIFQPRSERVAFLSADPEVDFQYVAEALDIAHQAGADRVGLMDLEPASTKR